MCSSQESTNHPTIGPIKGIQRFANITQFLGIQYGTLKDRYAQGELLEQYQPGPSALDATKLGYKLYFVRVNPSLFIRHIASHVVGGYQMSCRRQ